MKWRWKSDPQPSLMDSQLDDDSSGEGWGSDHGVQEEGAWSRGSPVSSSRDQEKERLEAVSSLLHTSSTRAGEVEEWSTQEGGCSTVTLT